VIEATDEALPVLKEQAARIRALTPPVELRTRIARFFRLVGAELIRFGRESAAAKRVGSRIGYRC